MSSAARAKTNTIEHELHQIRGHVQSTNIHITYLEQLLQPTPREQVSSIKAELGKALLNLEAVQQKALPTLPAVKQVARDVGRAYNRLQKLESQLWDSQSEPSARGELALQSSATTGRTSEDEEPVNGHRQATWLQSSTTVDREEQDRMMTGALPIVQSEPHRLYEGVQAPTRGCQTNGSHTPEDVNYESAVEVNEESPEQSGNYSRFSLASRRSRTEVMNELLEEEYVTMTRLHEPDKVRQGSTSGWQCARDIMCGVDDPRNIRPKLSFFKIHEVKALKTWLTDKKYLKRSAGISRTEKLLHLIFALQDGNRFEIIAVFFSRSPRQVYESCVETFEGVLEMHSETMLPAPDQRPLYDDFWKIVDRYTSSHTSAQAREYYPWSSDDVYKVLVTLNFYIGRWRKQGQSALDGPFLLWGDYVQTAEE